MQINYAQYGLFSSLFRSGESGYVLQAGLGMDVSSYYPAYLIPYNLLDVYKRQLFMSGKSLESPLMAAGVFLMFMLTVFRYYGDVEYRLNLNYRRYFIYYLLIGIGYLAGFGIYRLTGQWVWIYLIGEAAALAFVGVTGNIFHQFFRRSEFFTTALGRGFFLTLSYLITNTTMNMDRLVIKQILGNEQVTQYYVVSLIGKTLVLLIAPINTIVISYLTKRKERLTRCV